MSNRTGQVKVGDKVTTTYHVRTESGGWGEPMTYAETLALLPKPTEAKWQRIEGLEATVGRVHEADRWTRP